MQLLSYSKQSSEQGGHGKRRVLSSVARRGKPADDGEDMPQKEEAMTGVAAEARSELK